MKFYCAAIDGLYLTLTRIEADVAQGLPACSIVGLGDASIKEARERIRPAIKKTGYTYPLRRMVVNLSPAHLKKHGSLFDMPIALSLLYASGQIKDFKFDKIFCFGELTLDGYLREVPGTLALVNFAKKSGFGDVIIPFGNLEEASFISGINIHAVKNLKEAVGVLYGVKKMRAPGEASVEASGEAPVGVSGEKKRRMPRVLYTDMSEIYGHQIQKRALEIAVAGRHHILLIGSPGTGKTMLAKAIPGIMPMLDNDESIEVSTIYSLANKAERNSFPIRLRPFRHVHNSTSAVTLIGGGSPVKFGQVTLAHKGILFMDEFAEFPRPQLESLREPIQEGVVRIGRHGETRVLPADFQLVAAMNPCPCGYYGDSSKNCLCTPYQIKTFYKRLSGPIVDRIDMAIEVPRIKTRQLERGTENEKSHVIRKRVGKAWLMQKKRGIKNSGIQLKDLDKTIILTPEAKSFLKLVNEKMDLSPRSYLSVVRIARTIADLEDCSEIKKNHIAEAVQYKKSFVY